MKKGTKKLMALLLTAVMTVSVVGCGNGNDNNGNKGTGDENTGNENTGGSATESAEKVTVKFWTDGSSEKFQSYVRAYEEINKNVTIELSIFEAQDYKTQSRLALASGEKPDIWTTNIGEPLTQFINEGGALDLTEYIEEAGWNELLTKSALDSGTRDGKLYALPTNSAHMWQTLFVNKDFFEANNLEYPKTVDDLIALAPQIRDAGMEPMAWGNLDGWPAMLMLGDFLGQVANGQTVIDQLNSGEVTWDNCDSVKTALETMKKLADGDAFIKGYATSDQETNGYQAWLAEKAALLYNGTWFYTPEDEIPFEVETIALPLIDESTKLQSAQLTYDGMLMINPDTKVKDAAVDFYKYMISSDYYNMLATESAGFTPCPDANQYRDVPDWLDAEPLTMQQELPNFGYFDGVFPMAVVEAAKNNIKQIFDGSISIDEALQNIEAEHAANR